MTETDQHDSPARFVAQWITENGFEQIGYVGSFPALQDSASESVNITDCNGIRPWQDQGDMPYLQAVVVVGDPEHFTPQTLTQLLAGYRNALVEAILVLSEHNDDALLPDNEFYGLGFKKIASFPHPEHPLIAFEYNLRSYNHKRLWNNPKYWANPENFGKYWW